MRLDDDIDLTCPKCNGQMEINEQQTQAVCPYCGYQAFFEDESPERVQEIAYAYRKGVLKAEEEAAKKAEKKAARNSKKASTTKKKSGKGRTALIVIGIFLLIGLVSYAYERITAPEVDPFEAIDVVFEGSSGSGYAYVDVHSPTSGTYDAYDIDYEVSQRYGLAEGDTITVTATSTRYRLNPKTKVYTVEGLDLLLDDLEGLSGNAIDAIHARSVVTLNKAVSNSRVTAELQSLEPVVLYLYMENGSGSALSHNVLYDVYKATFLVNGTMSSELYLVAYYDDIVVRDSTLATIDYDYTSTTGDYVEIGDQYSNMENYGGYISGYKTLEEAKLGLQDRQYRASQMQERFTTPMTETPGAVG